MMRISAYEAFSFLASCKATEPRFSNSGLGLVEPCGAANRRVASAAAVLVSRNARLVSPLVSMVIASRNTEYTRRMHLPMRGPNAYNDFRRYFRRFKEDCA